MQRPILLLAICLMGMTSYGQPNVLQIYPNGLIYSDSTMGRLQLMADSLQEKFKHHVQARDYYSIRQGIGHAILLDTGEIRAALADMQRDIDYTDFIRKYPLAKVESFNLLTEEDAESLDHKKMLWYTRRYNPFSLDYIHLYVTPGWKVDSSGYRISGKKGRWVFEYTCPEAWPKEQIKAFYLLRSPSSQKLPDKYARAVLYTDVMTDTGATVFFKDAKEDNSVLETPRPKDIPAQDAFQRYLDKGTKRFLAKYDIREYEGMPGDFYELKYAYFRDSICPHPVFKRLLRLAAAEALRRRNLTDNDLEYYTELYYSKSAALRMKRNRIVMVMCGYDPTARVHILNIAGLAAGLGDWPVFLRAHIDIMAENFQRNDDGNMSGMERMTYLRELEELHLDVPALLSGISLWIVNPAQNHYFSQDIRRLGMMLADAQDRQALEEKILAMIRDSTLDDFNRLTQHNIFLYYTFYLPDKASRLAALEKLAAADRSMPAYISSRLKIDRASTREK